MSWFKLVQFGVDRNGQKDDRILNSPCFYMGAINFKRDYLGTNIFHFLNIILTNKGPCELWFPRTPSDYVTRLSDLPITLLINLITLSGDSIFTFKNTQPNTKEIPIRNSVWHPDCHFCYYQGCTLYSVPVSNPHLISLHGIRSSSQFISVINF